MAKSRRWQQQREAWERAIRSVHAFALAEADGCGHAEQNELHAAMWNAIRAYGRACVRAAQEGTKTGR